MGEIVREGLVEIELEHGVFYNPRMEFSRDICTAVLRARGSEGLSYADVMCATGIRGIRAAMESGANVTLNDADPRASALAGKNAEKNGIKAELHCRKAGALLFERRFDIVDIDPYGSPVPELTPAVYSASDMLAVTATDTAPLCGAHHRAGVRRYMASPLRTDYYGEVGLRVFVGAIVREAARIDRAATPFFAYSYSHHVRGYFEMKNGANRADKALDDVGYIMHCDTCRSVYFKAGTLPPANCICDSCGGVPRPIGPLWGGALNDGKFLRDVIRELVQPWMEKGKDALRLIETCEHELDIPYHYDQHRIAKRLGTSPPGMDSFLTELEDMGYAVSRTHFNQIGFKTDAPLGAIEDVLRSGKNC